MDTDWEGLGSAGVFNHEIHGIHESRHGEEEERGRGRGGGEFLDFRVFGVFGGESDEGGLG
jgi:hypothetical protein